MGTSSLLSSSHHGREPVPSLQSLRKTHASLSLSIFLGPGSAQGLPSTASVLSVPSLPGLYASPSSPLLSLASHHNQSWLSWPFSFYIHLDITRFRVFHRSLSSELGLCVSLYFLVCFCSLPFGCVTVPSPQCSELPQLWFEGVVVPGIHGGEGAVRSAGAVRSQRCPSEKGQ